jgi:hypothetical protein
LLSKKFARVYGENPRKKEKKIPKSKYRVTRVQHTQTKGNGGVFRVDK